MTGSAFWQKSAAFLLFLLSVAIFSSFSPAFAKEASPLAQDETAEKRLVDISSELRCLVCQNESLSGSQAELANDQTMLGILEPDRHQDLILATRFTQHLPVFSTIAGGKHRTVMAGGPTSAPINEKDRGQRRAGDHR